MKKMRALQKSAVVTESSENKTDVMENVAVKIQIV